MEKCKFYKDDACSKNGRHPCYDEYGEDCFEFEPEDEIPDITPEDIELKETSCACPEQYDALLLRV